MTRRLVTTTRQSMAGLRVAWGEEAFRIEAVMVLVLVPIAIWFGENALEQVLMIASLLIVMIVEVLNTAIEKTIDRVSTDRHVL
ncbi:MAG: diacylglycerol kinase, partial [Burkholderiaceae bacterium]